MHKFEIDTKQLTLHRTMWKLAKSFTRKRRRRCYPGDGARFGPNRVSAKLVVTRVTTGALSGALIYTVENRIPLAVGVRSHVLTRIVTGGEAGNVFNVDIVH